MTVLDEPPDAEHASQPGCVTNHQAQRLNVEPTDMARDSTRSDFSRLRLSGREALLARRARLGDEYARNQLVESHMGLVVVVARGFTNRGLPFEDLIQEGAIGLQRAVSRFDERLGWRLSTYAVPAISSAMHRAIARQARTIRLPEWVLGALGHVGRMEDRLLMDLGREATLREIAEAMGGWPTPWSLTPATETHIAWLKSIATMPPIPLDGPISDEGGSLFELVVDERALSPHEHLMVAMNSENVQRAVQQLTERERRILTLRYSENSGSEQTLQAVGATLGLTRERVRQIERAALDKLRIILTTRTEAEGWEYSEPRAA